MAVASIQTCLLVIAIGVGTSRGALVYRYHVIRGLVFAVLVYKFNKAELPPDAEQEEQMIAVMQPSTHLPDVGYRSVSWVPFPP